jgi:hypothetical protein
VSCQFGAKVLVSYCDGLGRGSFKEAREISMVGNKEIGSQMTPVRPISLCILDELAKFYIVHQLFYLLTRVVDRGFPYRPLRINTKYTILSLLMRMGTEGPGS